MIENTTSPLFSILIPTWNNLEILKLCVRSIENNSSFSHEILVHINDGSDGTLDWVKEKGIRHTHSAGNIGVCWALNR
ncbi:glycosyltransferase family 2 protein, partial [uncultured Duncaniella sp.]